jgi:uncharacterized protein YigE (DUF2233 family)
MKFAVLVLASLSSTLFAASWSLVESSEKPAPEGLTFREARVSNGATQAVLYEVGFAPKKHAFAVMDNPDGAFDLGSACAKRGALAGVNGGYFQPDRTPLGLVVRQGVEIHPLEKARLLSGVISVTPGAIAIQRTAAFKPSASVREALQAGPFLVKSGKKIAGLNVTKEAARTVVFQDAGGQNGFLICKSVSLGQMADILATAAIFPDGKIVRALNLDGGSSTALWVRGEPPFYQREWKTVRNYLAIVPRH